MIKVWEKTHIQLVVAIDGYAGSGKTTVADFISKNNPDALVVHLDDFIRHWKDRKQMMDTARNKSKIFELNWYRYNDLEKLIKKFKTKKEKIIKLKTYNFDRNDFGPKKSFNLSKKILVLDGIFLFHPRHKISKFFNKRIYLDINFNKADKKRILREKRKWGKSYIQENHTHNWIKHFKKAYVRYVKEYKPKKIADIVISV